MAKDMMENTEKLLGASDPAPFTILNEKGAAKCLLVCEHAGNHIPEALDNLGLANEDLERHYAVDIGARYVTERLSQLLDAPAILGNISRLVIDLNRDLSHSTAFVSDGEGTHVPGNARMSGADRQRRIDEIYVPFHCETGRLLRAIAGRGAVPAFIGIHSFTPVYYNQRRPWDIGFLWMQDFRMAKPAIEYFKKRGYEVGDNEPYDAKSLTNTTINRHADEPGYPNLLVEFRNDRINSQEKGEEWALMMADCLGSVLSGDDLNSLYEGPRAAADPERELRYFDDLIEQAKKGN
jgi:predicted N-formylglutamate amidohydrolase